MTKTKTKRTTKTRRTTKTKRSTPTKRMVGKTKAGGSSSRSKSKKWFEPKDNLSGWKKDQADSTRMGHLRDEINQRDRKPGVTRRDATVSVARSVQALANVTQDRATKQKARKDAKILFNQASTTHTPRKTFSVDGKPKEFHSVETNVQRKHLERRKKHWAEKGNYVRVERLEINGKVRYDIFALKK